ncbi:hypothetical protein COLO4_03237, partial [Corchorus olitorius]
GGLIKCLTDFPPLLSLMSVIFMVGKGIKMLDFLLDDGEMNKGEVVREKVLARLR